MSDLDVNQLREIERMVAYQQPNPYPASPRTIRFVNVLIAALILLAIALAVIKVYAESAQDQPICKAVANTPYDTRLSVAEWTGYPEGWADIPAEVWDTTPVIIHPDLEQLTGYVLYVYRDKLYIVPHWSFESRFDANGEHGGTHDLCDILIYTLGER